jgi:hypothetical protein
MRGKAVTFRPHTALVSGSLELTEPDVEEKLQVLPAGKTKTPWLIWSFSKLVKKLPVFSDDSESAAKSKILEW